MFRPRTAPDAIDLISHLLEYTPSARLTSVQAMAHSFFDELRAPDAQMPSGKPMPPLFDFTIEGAFDVVAAALTAAQSAVRPATTSSAGWSRRTPRRT